jgi:hypothetical protein
MPGLLASVQLRLRDRLLAMLVYKLLRRNDRCGRKINDAAAPAHFGQRANWTQLRAVYASRNRARIAREET